MGRVGPALDAACGGDQGPAVLDGAGRCGRFAPQEQAIRLPLGGSLTTPLTRPPVPRTTPVARLVGVGVGGTLWYTVISWSNSCSRGLEYVV